MSMPMSHNRPTRSQVITNIMQSIADEEAAIARILNVEAEKMQCALGHCRCKEDVLEVNASAECMVTTLTRLEALLHEKLELLKCHICERPCDED